MVEGISKYWYGPHKSLDPNVGLEDDLKVISVAINGNYWLFEKVWKKTMLAPKNRKLRI